MKVLRCMVHVFLITSYCINNMHSVRPICLCKENLWSIKWPSVSESTSSMISAQCVIEAFPRPLYTSAPTVCTNDAVVHSCLTPNKRWTQISSHVRPFELWNYNYICIVCQISLKCCCCPPARIIHYKYISIQIFWFLQNPKQTAYNKPRLLVPTRPLRESLLLEGQHAKHCVL